MKKKLKSVKMSDNMRVKAEALATAKSLADLQLRAFLEGCMAGLDLQGDWNLDTSTWTFIQMPKKPQEEDK